MGSLGGTSDLTPFPSPLSGEEAGGEFCQVTLQEYLI
jgi:hypothetical protein